VRREVEVSYLMQKLLALWLEVNINPADVVFGGVGMGDLLAHAHRYRSKAWPASMTSGTSIPECVFPSSNLLTARVLRNSCNLPVLNFDLLRSEPIPMLA
jgi:hypothetical protein